MDSKSLFTSRTFWFNVVMGLLAILQTEGVFELLPESVVAGGIAAGNVVIRILTKQPVHVA